MATASTRQRQAHLQPRALSLQWQAPLLTVLIRQSRSQWRVRVSRSLFWMNHALSLPRCRPPPCFLVTPEFFRMSRVRCSSPLPRCLYRPRYLYPRTSSGPMLIVGDNPVSGSLVSQSKCHSGELTFSRWRKPVQLAPVRGCHPCGSNHERTIPFVSDRPFFSPPP